MQKLLDQLKQDLALLPRESRCLEAAFESAAKHMPIYLKIVKTHIEQLERVLQLETHQHRSLENAGLAEPVTQLIQLFRELNDEDIQLLEILAEEAKNVRTEENEQASARHEASPLATEA